MADDSIDTAIIHLDGLDGYFRWPLPLPTYIYPIDLAVEEPEPFYELEPGDVILPYDYDDNLDRYVRRI